MHKSNVVSAWVVQAADALERAVPSGIGRREVEALTLVATHPGCTGEWLRARLGLSQSGTVRAVDRLQQLGYVGRARAGRTVALRITPQGSRVLRDWHRARTAVVDEVVGTLSTTDQERLVRLLARALVQQPRERPEADRACRTCEWPLCEPACPVDRSVAD
jgi:DNA-binding MarR family transcriptional regulator